MDITLDVPGDDLSSFAMPMHNDDRMLQKDKKDQVKQQQEEQSQQQQRKVERAGSMDGPGSPIVMRQPEAQHISAMNQQQQQQQQQQQSQQQSQQHHQHDHHHHHHHDHHNPLRSTGMSEVGILEGRKLYTAIMKQHTCYDLVPESGKIIVFEVSLLVRKAFFALLQNGVRSAPLWDSSKQQFVGMLTVTDFINILRFYYKSPLVTMDEVEEHRIQTWREVSSAKLPAKMVSMDPTATLYEATRMLVTSRIHRLPLIDDASNSAIAVLTHKRILHFMYNSMRQSPPHAFLTHSIADLNIGTYKNIATATTDTPLIVVLNTFAERRVSCLPIVDALGTVVDVYAKYDIINLARERTYNNLDVSVMEALAHRQEGFEGVVTCFKTDSLQHVLDVIIKTNVHRLIVIDSERHVTGIVSLSDILIFLMI